MMRFDNSPLDLDTWLWTVIALMSGCVLGAAATRLAFAWSRRPDDPSRPVPSGRTMLAVGLGTGLLFAAFAICMIDLRCQQVPYVTPDPAWCHGRLMFHLLLLTLLVAATVTDFRDYVVPDQVTLPGMLLGVGLAFASGDLQTIHLWIDWYPVGEAQYGGEVMIPDWIKNHRHWHGLAWSLAGLACGGGMTWIVRRLSSLVLGREALGFGDVTLMAMIGSFTGWQPVVFIFLLAPFCGLVVGLAVKVLANRPYVPYGPFLSAAAVAVLFGWRWLWLFPSGDRPSRWAIRNLFGDGVSLLILAGTAIAALCLLLGVVRLYQRIPVGARRGPPRSDTGDDQP